MESEPIEPSEIYKQPELVKKWSTDRILGISAIFVSFMTFLVLIYQTHMIREQQLLSALPYLQTGNMGFNLPNYTLYLKNEGIGPAFIEDIVIKYKGEVYENKDLAHFLINTDDSVDELPNLSYSNVQPGMLIPSGATIGIIEIRDDETSSIKFGEILTKYKSDGYEFKLVYSSIYGEKWKMTSESIAPEKL